MELSQLGWNTYFEDNFTPWRDQGHIPARVSRVTGPHLGLWSAEGERDGQVTGRFRHEAQSRAEFPSVGDWVAIRPAPAEALAAIVAVLPRRGAFSRKAAGDRRSEEQVLAANVDTVFLVSGLDGDFNLRRLERYLAAAWDSGAAPVVVLNKADAAVDPGIAAREAEAVAPGVPVHLTSALRGEGLEELRSYAETGRTVAFLGSSGVGKSSLINLLLGTEQMRVGAVRAYDNRGRHTTTHRELLLLPQGGILIDTPGMREIQVWADDEGLSRTFVEVEDLAGRCRFRDCRHRAEPDCAVRAALEDGVLDAKRVRNYLRMQREEERLSLHRSQWARMRSLGQAGPGAARGKPRPS
jgi:ribosome biogenesis GTPase / thiamine phosphate phosphatase